MIIIRWIKEKIRKFKEDRAFKKKLKEIMYVWLNVAFPNQTAERLHIIRALICSQCEFNIKNVCKKCGCPLIAKTRSVKSTCPLKKWNF